MPEYTFRSDELLLSALVRHGVVSEQDVLSSLSWSRAYANPGARIIHTTSNCMVWQTMRADEGIAGADIGVPDLSWETLDGFLNATSSPAWGSQEVAPWWFGNNRYTPLFCTECWFELSWLLGSWDPRCGELTHSMGALPSYIQDLVQVFDQSQGAGFVLENLTSALAWIQIFDMWASGAVSVQDADCALRRWQVDLGKDLEFVSPQAQSIVASIQAKVTNRLVSLPPAEYSITDEPLVWVAVVSSWHIPGGQVTSPIFAFSDLKLAGDRVYEFEVYDGIPELFAQVPASALRHHTDRVVTTRDVSPQVFSMAVKLCPWTAKKTFPEVLAACDASFV